MGVKVFNYGAFLDADSESRKDKMLPFKVMGIKQFRSLDRIVKHKFDCLGLGLWLWIASGLWLGVGLGLGFM